VCPPDDCPTVFDPAQADTDHDGVGDACDDCPGVADPEQRDSDGDGLGDACDPCTDLDGDGSGDSSAGTNVGPPDNCPGLANRDQTDTAHGGVGDVCADCRPFPTPDQKHPEVCVPAPYTGLTAADRTRFDAGLAAFATIETIGSGLGPVFN